MSILVLKLPDVKRGTEERPKECPYCEGETFQRWGQEKKPVRDTRCRNVQVYRYRCCRCRRTFRHYPEGTTHADQTERLRVFAVICWRLGLSFRGVSTILSGLGISVCHMTVWRDAQGEAEKLGKQNQWKPVHVLGLDGVYVLGWGDKRPVTLAPALQVQVWWLWTLAKDSRWRLGMWTNMIRRRYSAGWNPWCKEWE